MIKIGKYLVNTTRIAYVEIEEYPIRGQAYIPKVEFEEREVSIGWGKKKTEKVRICADCGEELDEGVKYCPDCYNDGNDWDDMTVITVYWENGELEISNDEITREEYNIAVKQLAAAMEGK